MDAGATHTVTAMAVSSDGTVTEFESQFTTEGREGSSGSAEPSSVRHSPPASSTSSMPAA